MRHPSAGANCCGFKSAVTTVINTNLLTPIAMAFLGSHDFLVLEKDTGVVKRVTNGGVQGVVLDLAVNNASERGLLGIALHPRFPSNPGVYLFWTCRSTTPRDSDPFTPEQECPDIPTLGADSGNLLEVPLLGNRVDRFVWNGSNAHIRSQSDQAASTSTRWRSQPTESGRRNAASSRQSRRRGDPFRP